MLNRSHPWILFILALSFAASAQAFPKFIPSRSGDYCRDELEDLLRYKFGKKVKVTNVVGLGQGDQWTLWATSNLCQGELAAKFFSEKSTCKQGSYGSRPRLLVAAFGHSGECKRLIPRSIYW